MKRCFGWAPPSDVWASHFSPLSVEGICHKSVALSKDFSKEKVYQGLSDWRVGTVPILNSLGSGGCAASSLLSHLCCRSPYLADFGQGGKHSRLNLGTWKFSVSCCMQWLRLCPPNYKKMCGENTMESVCSDVESMYLLFLDLPSRLSGALASRGTALGSFLQAGPSFSVRSALHQANSHLFHAGFLLCASFILLTFLWLLAALLGFCTKK